MLEFTPDSPLVTYSRWPQVRRGYRHAGTPVRGIVIHAAVTRETNDVAERVVDYFATGSGKANTHYSVDNNSVAQSVPENQTCYGAGGANNDMIHIEHAGMAGQSIAQWLDPYGFDLLELSSKLSAEISLRYDLKVRRLSKGQFRSGKKGLLGHADVVLYTGSGDHWDPGPGFPWMWYLTRVRHNLSQAGATPMEDISFGGRNHLSYPHADSDTHIVLTNPLVSQADHNLHILNLTNGNVKTYRHGRDGDHPFSVAIVGDKVRFRISRSDGSVPRLHNTGFVASFDLP